MRQTRNTRCLIPEFDGAIFSLEWKEALWARFVTGKNDPPDRFLTRFTLLDRPVHSFDLTIRPGVLDPGQPVLNLMLAADPVEDVLEGINVPIMIGELDAIIRQHDVEPVGHGSDEITQKGCCGHFPGLLVQLHESELGGAVNGNEQVKFAFSRLNLSNINVEVAERVGLELLLHRLVAINVGEAADIVSLKAAVQGRSAQVWDRRLQ